MAWILGILALVGIYWLSPAGKEARRLADQKRSEEKRQRSAHRDAEEQSEPYTYKIGRHGNEALAIRYGIANQRQAVHEYWYHGRGGEPQRNPSRDRVRSEDAETISLRKIRRVSDDQYEVELVDYDRRKAIAVIEFATEYVKTFYPMDERWFDDFSDLELTLKGNGTFTLKELARIHVDKVVGRRGQQEP